jgi:putative SOS response-associated peptidase YedK
LLAQTSYLELARNRAIALASYGYARGKLERHRRASEFAGSYNVAPTTLVDMVRHNAEGQRELVRGVRWGLIPR